MEHKKYTVLSGAILFITAILAVIQYCFIESGSIYEKAIFITAGSMFVALSFINLRIASNSEFGGMERAHAAARCAMFLIGSAFGFYLGFKP